MITKFWRFLRIKFTDFDFVCIMLLFSNRSCSSRVDQMNTIEEHRGFTFMRIVMILWFISSVLIIVLLGRIDQIIHVDLYKYNLQFSNSWADPYWFALRMIYVFLAIPIVAGAVALIISFTRRTTLRAVEKQVETKSINGKNQPVKEAPAPKENSMLISCPKCKRTFAKPLSMLEFIGGKTQLVSACPYCNHVLGSVDSDEDSDDFHIAEREKEERVRDR